MGEEVEREGREGVRRALPALCCEEGRGCERKGEDARGRERMGEDGRGWERIRSRRSRKEREGAIENGKLRTENGKRKLET